MARTLRSKNGVVLQGIHVSRLLEAIRIGLEKEVEMGLPDSELNPVAKEILKGGAPEVRIYEEFTVPGGLVRAGRITAVGNVLQFRKREKS
jgi:hypothetical protein